jgi:ABC-type Fe3+-hydroxamate transport system substrate-binding protein
MPVFSDQMGRKVTVPARPTRIVSLVPSQTELLHFFGLDNEVVGITRFCVHPPEWLRTKTKVGGTKKVEIEVVRQLKPDLIVANKEENERELIEVLEKEFPVWLSDVANLQQALTMILMVGQMTGREAAGQDCASRIQQQFSDLKPLRRKKALYLIWRKPWMAAGKDTFIDDMLMRAGFTNAVTATRYPQLNADQLTALQPEVVLLSSEPYPFKEAHVAELRTCMPAAKFCFVNGEMFSWYGSRLLHAPEYFMSLDC